MTVHVIFSQTNTTIEAALWGYYSTNSSYTDEQSLKNYTLYFLSEYQRYDVNNMVRFYTLDNKQIARIQDIFTDNPHVIYTLQGTITKKGDIYTISTMIHGKNREYMKVCYNETGIEGITGIMMKHAKEIYDYFSLLRTEISLSLNDALKSFESGEYAIALDKLNIIENKHGKSQQIDELRNQIIARTMKKDASEAISSIDTELVKAEYAINVALSNKVSPDETERFYNEAIIIIRRIKELTEQIMDKNFDSKMNGIERKISEYEENYRHTIYTGGFEFFLDKPFPFILSGPDIDLQETYPHLLGFSFKYIIPFDSVLMFYVNLGYVGINNHAEQMPLYLTDAAFHSISLSLGMHIQLHINKTIAPYLFFGSGYTHLIEYAADEKDSVILNFPGGALDVGAGVRAHITPNLALDGKFQWSLCIYETMMHNVTFSIGAAYLFHGREIFIRK
jgi:hypothetical protein